MQDVRAKGLWGSRWCHTAALALLLVGCGGSDASTEHVVPAAPNPAPGETPARFERLVCPQCVGVGGETTDFGDGSAYLPGGAAQKAVPTDCELSTEVSSIELDAARALGFDVALDQLETSFDQPLAWIPTADKLTRTLRELVLERPARGYSAAGTRIRGTTHVVSAQHYAPSLTGCTDTLEVEVATTLETDDGALSIAGTLHATLERGARRPTVGGLLDLSQARGTLEIDPPPSSGPVFGYVDTRLYLWPDTVRLTLSVGAVDPRELGGDTFSYYYKPLDARGPIDECETMERPLAFDEATPSIRDGQSLADRFPELLALIRTPQPFAARWIDGAETSLDIEFSEPRVLCDQAPGLRGLVPYRVRSGDGRVDIDSEAIMQLGVVNDVDDVAEELSAGWFEIYPFNVVPAASFAQETGISGVDLSEYGAGFWYTELYFDASETPATRGDIIVKAVDVDGHLTGSPGTIMSPEIESLSW